MMTIDECMNDISYLAEELPDGYFTPTIADLKARQQHLHARAVAANNAPLLTRAQREEQAKMKRDRWPNVCTIISLPPTPPPCPSLGSIIFLAVGVVHKIDHDQGELPRPHTARKGVPIKQQDTQRICVRARRAARGRQVCQIHIMYVPAFGL